jgi:hypothetical protein
MQAMAASLIACNFVHVHAQVSAQRIATIGAKPAWSGPQSKDVWWRESVLSGIPAGLMVCRQKYPQLASSGETAYAASMFADASSDGWLGRAGLPIDLPADLVDPHAQLRDQFLAMQAPLLRSICEELADNIKELEQGLTSGTHQPLQQ